MRISDHDVADAWKEYKQTATQGSRDRLLLHYHPLVRHVAKRLAVGLPSFVDVDDLESMGFFGLLDAIEKFDLTRGVRFKTYAQPRIRGSILDELRIQDWVPRLVYIKAHRIDKARQQLEHKLGRAPTFPEMAGALRMSFRELVREFVGADARAVISLSDEWTDHKENHGNRKIDLLEDKRPSADPVRALMEEEEVNNGRLFNAAGLTEDEVLALKLYYVENLQMKKIGEIFDLSESRICQNITGAQRKLERIFPRHNGYYAVPKGRRP